MLAVKWQWQQQWLGKAVALDDVVWQRQQHVGGAVALDDGVWQLQLCVDGGGGLQRQWRRQKGRWQSI
jgi:hypothetical protein